MSWKHDKSVCSGPAAVCCAVWLTNNRRVNTRVMQACHTTCAVCLLLRYVCTCCRVDQINDTLLKISGLEDTLGEGHRDD
jgi:hypothetical protein